MHIACHNGNYVYLCGAILQQHLILNIMRVSKKSFLESLDPSRVDVLLQSNGTWVCLVDGEPYLVESAFDFDYVRRRAERLIYHLRGLQRCEKYFVGQLF